MTQSPVPNRVNPAEVERICAYGENTPACLRMRELLVEWQKWEAARDKEQEQIRAAREQRRAEEAQARAAAQEAERAAAAAALEESLRGRFFVANPTAAEADWERLKDRVIDDHLVEQMRLHGDREVEGLAARLGAVAYRM